MRNGKLYWMSDLTFKSNTLDHPDVIALLQRHLEEMQKASPLESVHALGLAEMHQPGMDFWTAWRKNELAGCGALKRLSASHAEIKSMRTHPKFLRQGIAEWVLKYLIAEARANGYRRLSLETGSQDYFEPARRLYLKHGFAYCDPFSDYTDDPNSVFMSLKIN